MEFSSIWYFSFCSLVSLVFSTTGIYALRTAIIPVSGLVELQLETWIVLSVSCSATYAFLFRPLFEHDRKLETSLSNKIFLHFYLDFATGHSPLIALAASAHNASSGHRWGTFLVLFSALLWLAQASKSITMGFKYSRAIGNFLTGFAGPLRMYPHHSLCWLLIQGLVLSTLSVLASPSLDLYVNLILVSANILSSLSLFASNFKKLEGSSSMAAYAYKHRKIVEIILGCLGTTLAQYYFKAKSVPLMLSFLSLAIAWLGNLANVQPCTDFGIFHFLVTASLECAVSLFGLHLYTFLVVMAGIFLMVLRWEIIEFELVSLRYDGMQESVLKDWKRLEELYGGNDSTLPTQQLEQPSNIG